MPLVPLKVLVFTLLPYAKYTRDPGGARMGSGADDAAGDAASAVVVHARGARRAWRRGARNEARAGARAGHRAGVDMAPPA